MSKYSPISTSLSPNTESDDVRLALKLLFQPQKWKKGKATDKLQSELSKYLEGQAVYGFNSGRSALYSLLKAMGIKKGDEIIIQGLSCIAVPEPIIWAGGKPVYADIKKENYNIDPVEIKRKINYKTKAVIIQHTFGRPAPMEKIKKITSENNLLLIEDCAHSLGIKHKKQKIGTLADAAFFSFGRDKSISSVYGGAATAKDDKIQSKLETIHQNIPRSGHYWTFQQLLHPVLFNYLILPLYNFLNLGKITLILAQKTNLLSRAVSKKEKAGGKPSYFPEKIPNALARLALYQLDKLEKFTRHRRKISRFYSNKLKDVDLKLPQKNSLQTMPAYLRYPVETESASELILKAREENIILGDWYSSVFMPAEANLEKINYKKGSCPNAESLTYRMLNLPTHINITKAKAQKIVNFLKHQL